MKTVVSRPWTKLGTKKAGSSIIYSFDIVGLDLGSVSSNIGTVKMIIYVHF